MILSLFDYSGVWSDLHGSDHEDVQLLSIEDVETEVDDD